MGVNATYCSRCEHVSEPTMHLHPRLWLCLKHPNIWDGFGFVTEDTWEKAEPYLRCLNVNGGACPLFEQRREQDEN